MRIFYGFDIELAQHLNQSDKDIWTLNIRDTLVEMGHEVINFDYNLGEFFQHLEKSMPAHVEYSNANKEKVVKAFLEQIKRHHKQKPIDILLSYFYDHFMTKEAILEVKKMGIKTLNYNCNASYQLELIEDISPAFDYCLTVETFRHNDYKNIGANPIYFQEAANINYYKPLNEKKIYDAIFIGQSYGDRPAYVNYLQSNGINLKVFGSGWNQCSKTKKQQIKNLLYSVVNKKKVKHNLINPQLVGSRLTFDEMIKLYSQAKIAVNFSTCGNTHKQDKRVTQIRLRDFEAPACKICYITEYSEELEEFYEIDKEILCYKSKEELLDKIKFCLENDSFREQIAKAGFQRVIKDHSWHNRFNKLFNEIELSA
ncbi:glycosyltransferase [Rickettsiales bacterium]|nr:glycosyltransferase [Rickettsiales bacterium]